MKTYASPSRYRYCISRLSMTARRSFSSARKVRWRTRPVRKFFSLVRPNAPPLPGFTCWNSTTVIRPSGRLRPMPFFRSLEEMLTGGGPGSVPRDDERLGGFGEGGGAVLGDHHGVFDADPADAGEVDAGFDRDDGAGIQRTRRGASDPGGLVDLEADAVAGAVHEPVAEAGVFDDRPARPGDLRAGDTR